MNVNYDTHYPNNPSLSFDPPSPLHNVTPWVHCNEVLICAAAITAQKAFLATYMTAKQGNLYISMVMLASLASQPLAWKNRRRVWSRRAIVVVAAECNYNATLT